MSNSVAIVTGASQGIGQATAIRLGRDFSAIVLVARNRDNLEQTAQAVKAAGAKVIGIARPANHAWLSQHGVEAVTYGEGLADRLRKFGLNAFIDCHGGGYVNLAIELGVPKDRIDTIIDFAAAQQYGAKTEGSQEARNSRILAELAGLVAKGKLDVPVAATFPLANVRAAFRQLEQGHTRGKIVLAP